MASSADVPSPVLITGATGGIGQAVARALADAGAELYLVARTRDRLEAVAEELGAAALPGDAGRPEDVEVMREVVESRGGLAALVNAAGTFDLAPVAETDPAMFEAMIHGNLRGPFLMTRAFLPGMLARGRGHVVTIGSVAGRVAFPGNGAYSASKFGIRGLHAVLDQELQGTGVRSTLVEPAATDTGIWDPLDPDARDDLPGREAMLSPEAVAETVQFVLTRPEGVSHPIVAVQRS